MAVRRISGDLESMLRCGHSLNSAKICAEAAWVLQFSMRVLLDFLSNLRTIRRSSEKPNYEEEDDDAVHSCNISAFDQLRGGFAWRTYEHHDFC